MLPTKESSPAATHHFCRRADWTGAVDETKQREKGDEVAQMCPGRTNQKKRERLPPDTTHIFIPQGYMHCVTQNDKDGYSKSFTTNNDRSGAKERERV